MKRTEPTEQENLSTIEFTADLNENVPYSDRVVNRTSFTDEKRIRGGMKVFYLSVDDVILAAKHTATGARYVSFDFVFFYICYDTCRTEV